MDNICSPYALQTFSQTLIAQHKEDLSYKMRHLAERECLATIERYFVIEGHVHTNRSAKLEYL